MTDRHPGGTVASKYSDELKATVVRRVSVEGVPLTQVADEAGVNPATLRRWIKAAGSLSLPGDSADTGPAEHPLRLVILDGADIGAKLEHILNNEGFQPEVCCLQAHTLAHGMPEAEWLGCATLFILPEAGARRLVNLIQRSGKDIPIAWLGAPAAGASTSGGTLDCEWVPEASTERVCQALGRLHERRRLRTQLRDCQRHFEHLQRCCLRAFDGSPNPIAIIESQGHIYANTAYMRVFGSEDFAALRGRSPSELLAPRDAQSLAAALATLQDHERIALDIVSSAGLRMRAELERFPGSSHGVQLILHAQTEPAADAGDVQPEPWSTALYQVPAVDASQVDWAERVAQALKEDDRFSIVYQPIVSLFGGGEANYEALLRLHDEQGSEYLPGVFLPAARHAGLMGVVDQWVIRRAAMQVKSEWAAGRPVRIFVNLARESLGNHEFQQWLGRLIEYFQIPAQALVFEIPEPVSVLRLRECRGVIDELRALGCGVVLDSFDGSEDACARLDDFAVDFVKFDLSRIRLLTDDNTMQERIRRIVTRTHALGRQVIASRVQDAPSVALLWQCSVDYVQGYFLQQPSQALDYDFLNSECEVSEKRGQSPFPVG